MHAFSHLAETSQPGTLTAALQLVSELDPQERSRLEAMLLEAERYQRTRPTGYVSESVETIARIVGEAVRNQRESRRRATVLRKV